MCKELVQLIYSHWVAISLSVGYTIVAGIAAMPEPGTWQESGGFYGFVYRWTHILANAPAARVIESKLDIPQEQPKKYTGA